MKKIKSMVLLLVAIALLGLAITACGGSDSAVIIPSSPALPVGCDAGKAAPDIAVDAVYGDDGSADGTCALPYQTISAALAVATSGDAVWVNTGTYDLTNGEGENFPIVVPAGVRLIGDIGNNGDGGTATLISGKGYWTGSIFNTAVFPGDGSTVSGFSIDTDGYVVGVYALIANDASVTISNNTFLSTPYGGLKIEGAGDSLIEKNVISASSYGVYLYGTGVTIIQDNTFPGASFGIDNAKGDNIIRRNEFTSSGDIIQVQANSPTFEDNDFSVDIFVQSASTPVFRNNTFTVNTGPAIKVNATANPDLGTDPISDPGGNVFTVSSGADVEQNSSATVFAMGNTWTGNPPSCGTNITGTGTVEWGTGGTENCP